MTTDVRTVKVTGGYRPRIEFSDCQSGDDLGGE
jgi:hypothetical protein